MPRNTCGATVWGAGEWVVETSSNNSNINSQEMLMVWVIIHFLNIFCV